MALSINLEDHYNYTLLELDGDINARSSGLLKSALNRAINEGNSHIVLECSMLTSISSSGLKVLLSTQRKISGSYHISMCNVASHISSLLEMSGMTRFIDINTNVEDAETMMMETDYSQGRIHG